MMFAGDLVSGSIAIVRAVTKDCRVAWNDVHCAAVKPNETGAAVVLTSKFCADDTRSASRTGGNFVPMGFGLLLRSSPRSRADPARVHRTHGVAASAELVGRRGAALNPRFRNLATVR